MLSILHKANSRGHADHGWLNSYHTFSFANYYDPDRINFGMLRVLNDDTVAGGRGFAHHPHEDMEIISIPLKGDLEHRDSMGNVAVIKEGDVQVMSAGTGINHSEKNHNLDKTVEFLQIWLLPNKRSVKPRYDQISLDPSKLNNNLLQILSPDQEDEGVWVHQDAWFHMGHLSKGFQSTYTLKNSANGVYAFVIEGQVNLAELKLDRRDGMGIWEIDHVEIEAITDSTLLLIEVPMRMEEAVERVHT
jgi:redox-sensitive bicupin YhaK (pirin superfamily)